jgi:2'-5' RNA ligase
MQQVSFQPVLVEYGGFGVFKKPNANVAYLKVTSPSLEQVIQLFRNTLTDLQPVIPKKVSLHITIAKGIPDNDIDRVLLELQSERCKGDFALDKLTLYVGRIDQAGWTVAH